MPSEDEEDAAVDAAIDTANQGSDVARTAQAGGLPPVTPDVVEQEAGSQLDNIVPTRGYTLTPTVGLGGSAGGIQALTEFFEVIPVDSGLVFVVVLHLSPEHESTLAELLGRRTRMPVVQAEDGMVVESNHVYVIPPGKHLASVDGHLKLSPLETARGKRMAVDVFFRTLADTHGAHSAAIVFSGVDGDGAIGLKRIKERGGLTVAQDPDEAEHEGMPRSAIDTGMVDWVLKAREIPTRLLEYFARERRIHLPSEQPPVSAVDPDGSDAQESTLREVLAYLHARTGRDFSYYKRATTLRRVARRMQINGAENLAQYLTFLRTHPGEAGALLQDMLISVTNFFRDREAFAALEALIPNLFRGKDPGDTVRVWVPACATGEEAYSVAMLLAEHSRKLKTPPQVQIFATDLSEEVVQVARDGIYPAAITTDVSEERLARFFIKEHRGYRVRRELREIVLFAQHDLLKDSPFSKLDLITCRNLLIYLERDAQRRALDIFHFSLVRHGTLFLGTSESVDDASELFTPLDKKHRLYTAHPIARISLPVPIGIGTLARALQEREQAAERPVLPTVGRLAVEPPALPSAWVRAEQSPAEQARANELYLRVLAQVGPATLIVNAQHNIVHLSGAAGRYLQFGGGEMTRNLFQIVHPMLRVELRAALYRATQTQGPVEVADVSIEVDGRAQTVDLRVSPAQEAAPDLLLVTITPHASAASPMVNVATRSPEINPATEQLEGELDRLKRHLRDVQEQHEVTVEEHKASHEELQAINEELRSASEELETSREELQSINEELTTVNSELKGRVDELGRANGDMHNLMAATNIATVFLDRELRITRYTPSAVSLFKLIPTDVGRPLDDIKHRLDYPELEEDTRRVLSQLTPIEREVGQVGDGWFLARLQPYRSLDDYIEGVVLTFVDITERKQAKDALQESETQFRSFVEVSSDTVYKMSADWTVMRQLVGKEFLVDTLDPSRTWLQTYIPPDERPRVRAAVRVAIANKAPFELEHRVIRADDGVGWTYSRAVPILDERGEIKEWLGTASDVTERRQSRDALCESEERLQTLAENLPGGAAFIVDRDLRYLLASGEALRQAGLQPEDLVGKTIFEALPSELAVGYEPYFRQALSGKPFSHEHFSHDRTFLTRGAPLRRADGETYAVLAVSYDITERKRAEQAVLESEQRLRTLADAVPQIIWANSGDGVANYFNQRWYEYSGLTFEQSHGLGWPAIVHPDDAPRSVPAWEQALAAGTIFDAEYRLRRADGEYRWFIGRNVPIKEESGRVLGWFGSATDIHDLKEAQQEAQRARQAAEAAGAAKDHFLAVLSHELRTPLMPITMALAVLENRQDLPAFVTKTFAMIRRNVELESRFIDDLLDVTRIERGKMEIVREDINLHHTIERAVEVSAPDIQAKGQKLTVALQGEACPFHGDFARLQQMFWNLLKNASKFTPHGGVIEVYSRCQVGGQFVVEVTDTGIGMAAETAGRIFRPFEQADASITREFGGLGLGLSIAKATVEAHGGTLSASSPGPGQGATFTVILPLTAPAGANVETIV